MVTSDGDTGKSSEAEPEQAKVDLYALTDIPDDDIKWRDLSDRQRVKWVITAIPKPVLLIGLLYLFICSLDALSAAFQLLGGKAAGEALSNNEVLQNPVAGLMIGVLVTVLVQSSSTSTSIVVSMVSAEILQVKPAIPIIMGANIGTTVTNTIVALGQTADRNQFRRAFAAATVHDMFNWLCVFVLLPLEVISGYLFEISNAIIQTLPSTENNGTGDNPQFLKALTKPLTSKIVSLDSSAIKRIAKGEGAANLSIIKKGDHLFSDTTWSDAAVGALLLAASLLVLCTCLVLIVKLLHAILKGKIARLIRKLFNAEFDGCMAFLSGLVAIIVGAGLTILVQSSSIFTSAITPLVGVGVIHIDRMYPLTLGANIGTTGTSILAALASSGNFYESFKLALCHLFFNLTGVFLFYVIYPLRKLPINAAKYMGNVIAEYRWFAIAYLILLYFLLPGLIFAISLAGPEYLMAFGIPALVLIVLITVINVLQSKLPKVLPSKLRTWNFLPEWLRSLAPYDRFVVRVGKMFVCKCGNSNIEDNKDSLPEEQSTNSYYLNVDSFQNKAFRPDEIKGIQITSDTKL
ncbi:sodium-dependent phosphate transport protein 2B-like [Ylistrum balloti]|uniref:sodium-dependent phosphate transport protein 2B-like n=1 Tax=Ylistrum balloti TaxID=509963 RepID=UPI002905A34A|nr:sodium-dependent phosphate transport protein 2B-like [Ylistrum balloti]